MQKVCNQKIFRLPRVQGGDRSDAGGGDDACRPARGGVQLVFVNSGSHTSELWDCSCQAAVSHSPPSQQTQQLKLSAVKPLNVGFLSSLCCISVPSPAELTSYRLATTTGGDRGGEQSRDLHPHLHRTEQTSPANTLRANHGQFIVLWAEIKKPPGRQQNKPAFFHCSVLIQAR